jgi:pimeloyl-ACP methyl ester carboxylesterase
MTDRLSSNPADYIVPLNINKLEGRMMLIPPPSGKSREILIVAGRRSMLERYWSLAENFADYGTVTMPDLPGFGGMDSFEKIGIKPSIDAHADYLAAFLKLRFKRKKITLVGVAYGFVVITRMLQKYPDLTKKVDLLISLGGYMHKDDLTYGPVSRKLYRYSCRLLATKSLCLVQKGLFINYPVIKFVYSRRSDYRARVPKLSKEENDASLEFETRLWQVNDLRTGWLSKAEILNVDNCQTRLNIPVIQVAPKDDHYLHDDLVKEHMLVAFTGCKRYVRRDNPRALSAIADKKDAGVMLPQALRRTLAKPS